MHPGASGAATPTLESTMSLSTRLTAIAALTLSALGSVQAAPLNTDGPAIYRPTGRGYGEVDEQATDEVRSRLGEAEFAKRLAQLAAASATGISYHGGPVMTAAFTNVYYIYYGTWTATQKSILNGFMQTLGGTPIFNINTTYYNSAGAKVKNAIVLAGTYADNYSMGKTLSDAGVKTIVSNAINGGHLPKDGNGVYFVLTAPDVKESSGFGSKYCGWHTYAALGGTAIKYSFVGNASVIAPTAMVAIPTSLRMRSANGVWYMRPYTGLAARVVWPDDTSMKSQPASLNSRATATASSAV